MNKRMLALIALLFILVPSSVGAVEMISEDQVVIDTQIDDDLFVSGGTITINAPINGDVFASGGMIEINAPINGDLFAAAGQISVNADVTGKIIAVGGMIDIEGNVEKVMVAGGTISIKSGAVVEKYVFAAGGTVNNAGTIKEDFYVATETFNNTGTVLGDIEVEEPPSYEEEFKAAFGVFSILWKIGFLILGIILIKKFGKIFFRIEEEVRESFIKKMVLGFVFILLAVVIIFVLGITIIGAPIAVLLGLFFVMALMVAGLVVSYTFGDWLLTKLKATPSELVAFVVGFIIINLLFLIPVAGFLIQIIVVSLGFGAIFYAVKDNWETITAPRT